MRSISLFSLSCLLLIGCKNLELREASFVPEFVDVSNRFDASLTVQVRGGSDGTEVIFEKIPRPSFKRSLETAIVRDRLFTQLVENGAGYELTVFLGDFVSTGAFDSPESSYTAESRWKLVRGSDGTIVWESKVKGTGSSSIFDGGKRTREARERAIQSLIAEGLRLISRLNL